MSGSLTTWTLLWTKLPIPFIHYCVQFKKFRPQFGTLSVSFAVHSWRFSGGRIHCLSCLSSGVSMHTSSFPGKVMGRSFRWPDISSVRLGCRAPDLNLYLYREEFSRSDLCPCSGKRESLQAITCCHVEGVYMEARSTLISNPQLSRPKSDSRQNPIVRHRHFGPPSKLHNAWLQVHPWARSSSLLGIRIALGCDNFVQGWWWILG